MSESKLGNKAEMVLSDIQKSPFDTGHCDATNKGAAGKQEDQHHWDCDDSGRGKTAAIIGIEL